MIWNVITDSKTADFSWFKNLYNYICEFSKRHKISLHMIKNLQDCSCLPENSILIILGNNKEWLSEIEGFIQHKKITVVLMIGYGDFSNNRIIRIRYDMNSAIMQSINLLKEKGRIRPACFGIQSKDSADLIKADTFIKRFCKNDIYYDEEGLDKCFERFFCNIEQYDSVICSNDIMALFLQKKCKEFNIAIPERLHIVSIGNLWVSSHTSPSITTFECNLNNFVEVLWKILNVKQNNDIFSKVDVLLEPKLIKRKSTCDDAILTKFEKLDRYSPVLNFNEELDPQVCKIRDFDLAFSSFNELEIKIITELINNKSYEEIATNNFISIDALKYHIKKVYSRLEINSRKELLDLVKEYSLVLESGIGEK